MVSTVISYPIPPYQNLPIEPQNYKPRQFFISGVDLGVETAITTTEDMDYEIGQEVRLLIPPTFGCRQLNNQTGFVVSIPFPNEVTLNIDSSQNVDPFTSSNSTTQPQILAIGDINNGSTNNQGRINNITYPPGAFINISPK
jgi:hypothetical protein